MSISLVTSDFFNGKLLLQTTSPPLSGCVRRTVRSLCLPTSPSLTATRTVPVLGKHTNLLFGEFLLIKFILYHSLQVLPLFFLESDMVTVSDL